jgi:hypothetical protein
MIRKILSLGGDRLKAVNENASRHHEDELVAVADVRALATEAALATSVDASPAVLIGMWSHGQRLHTDQRAPRRRAS